jgi:CRP/FNR family cyclic AMP-dependent transcriptional regulator
MEWRILNGVSEEDRRQILATARRRRFDENEVVFHEGDPGASLHLLAKGRVAVRVTTPLGDTATLNLLGPGEAFGELALLSRTALRTATVVALEPVETLSLHRDQFEELRQRYPSIERFLSEALAARVERLSEQLLEALFVPADKRVVRCLLSAAGVYGGVKAGTVVNLTQEDLAGLAGTTRPTVNRVLQRAAEDEAVVLGRGRIEIVDPDQLERRAR